MRLGLVKKKGEQNPSSALVAVQVRSESKGTQLRTMVSAATSRPRIGSSADDKVRLVEQRPVRHGYQDEHGSSRIGVKPCARVDKANKTGERCDATMHGLLIHLQQRNCAPSRQRAHTALKRTLTMELRRVHVEVDVERVVLFFSSPQTAAILDVVACAPGDHERFLIDVTVRALHARLCGKAALIP